MYSKGFRNLTLQGWRVKSELLRKRTHFNCERAQTQNNSFQASWKIQWTLSRSILTSNASRVSVTRSVVSRKSIVINTRRCTLQHWIHASLNAFILTRPTRVHVSVPTSCDSFLRKTRSQNNNCFHLKLIQKSEESPLRLRVNEP